MGELREVDPILLSQYIISYLNEKGQEVNHLKLQKLIYYVDAWHNAYFDVPLIKEDFEAWMHGPVVRKVWDYYKGKSVLFTPIRPSDATADLSTLISKEQLELINDVLDEYGDKSSYYLECLTHSEKPWKKARHDCGPTDRCEAIITKDSMKQFYKEILYGQE